MTADTSTSRLRLRSISDADAGPTAALITNAVSRWTATWPAQVSTQEVAQRIADWREREAQGVAVAQAIERLSDGVLMGWITAGKERPEGRVATVGYWIGEAFHGQGYMTEALGAFLSLVWTALDIDRLEAGAQPENSASVAILARAGMRYMGERHELAPVRNRVERCAWYALDRVDAQGRGLK